MALNSSFYVHSITWSTILLVMHILDSILAQSNRVTYFRVLWDDQRSNLIFYLLNDHLYLIIGFEFTLFIWIFFVNSIWTVNYTLGLPYFNLCIVKLQFNVDFRYRAVNIWKFKFGIFERKYECSTPGKSGQCVQIPKKIKTRWSIFWLSSKYVHSRRKWKRKLTS